MSLLCVDISLSKGLFISGETSHLSEILFVPRLHDKNIPPERDIFRRSWPACLFLSSYVTFIVYLFLIFISILNYYEASTLLNFIRWISLFHVMITKTHRVYKNYLTCVEVRSHLGAIIFLIWTAPNISFNFFS